MIDVSALSIPLEGGSPSGPNLEYDGDFLALESDVRGKPERQIGDTLIRASEPEWASIDERALALLSRSRDLRLACYLTRARTRLDGLAGLAEGLTLIERLCTTFWPSLHPAPDADDPDDMTVRFNVLAVLVDGNGLLQDLRAACLVEHRGIGMFSVRDAELALGILSTSAASDPSDDGATGSRPEDRLAQIREAIRAAQAQAEGDAPANQALAAAESLQTALSGLAGAGLDLAPLLARLRPLARLCDEALAQARHPEGEDVATALPGGDDAEAGLAMPGRARAGAQITSRVEALRALDRVCEFLERSEPTNPAPLLIRRAQRLMTMPFVDIIREIAPEGIESLNKIAGLVQNEA